jgi:hypothetical protein
VQDAEAGGARDRAGQKCRLADAGFAPDHENPAASPSCAVEQRGQRVLLTLSSDQDVATGRPVHEGNGCMRMAEGEAEI